MNLSKEEIEKAKDVLNNYKFLFSKNVRENADTYINNHYTKVCRDSMETLLQYIDQLEGYLERISKQLDNVAIDQIPIGITELQQENNKLNKIIDEMVEQLTTLALWDNQDKKVVLIKANQDIRQYFEKKVGGK